MSERIDDRLLFLAQRDKMGVPELLNAHFKPHGNWVGCRLGRADRCAQ